MSKAQEQIGVHAALSVLEHDPEKLADFSNKITRSNKEKLSAIESTRSNRALEHDPEKLADFSDKIMRSNKEKLSVVEST